MLLEGHILRELNLYLSRHRVALTLEGLRKMSVELPYAAALLKKDEIGQVCNTKDKLRRFIELYKDSLPGTALEMGYGYKLTKEQAQMWNNEASIFSRFYAVEEMQQQKAQGKRHRLELDLTNNMMMHYEFMDILNQALMEKNYEIDFRGLRALVNDIGNIRNACVAKEEDSQIYFIKSQLEALMAKHWQALVSTCIEKGYATPVKDK